MNSLYPKSLWSSVRTKLGKCASRGRRSSSLLETHRSILSLRRMRLSTPYLKTTRHSWLTTVTIPSTPREIGSWTKLCTTTMATATSLKSTRCRWASTRWPSMTLGSSYLTSAKGPWTLPTWSATRLIYSPRLSIVKMDLYQLWHLSSRCWDRRRSIQGVSTLCSSSLSTSVVYPKLCFQRSSSSPVISPISRGKLWW